MTFAPFLSLAMFGLGVLLVIFGQRDPLRRRIAGRISAIAGETPGESRQRWSIRNGLHRWDGVLFGPIMQEAHLVAGTIRSGHVLAFGVGLAIAGGAALWLGGWAWLATVTVVGAVLGRRAVKFVAEHHRRQFLQHFPAYLDRVRKLVEVGNSLNNAMKKAMAFANPKVASYLAPALKRHELGMHLATALDTQAKQLGIREISQLALVAYVISRYGGSLTDSVAHIAQVERDRLQANRELEALTAEVRASAKVFVALPLFIAGAIFAIEPSYVSFFTSDPMGPIIIACCAVSMFVGLTIMRRMSRIE